MKESALALKHFLLATLVVAIWGFNFALIQVGLRDVPPIFLCVLRFFLVAFPAILFLPKPKISWKLLCGYGIPIFALQFVFLFTGMFLGMSAGLAALVLQVQGVFTMALAAYFFGDRPSSWKIAGACISFFGIAIVGYYTQGTTSFLGFVFTLLAALCWSVGSVVSKKIGPTPPLNLVVWGGFVALPILAVLSLIFEGSTRIFGSFQHLTLASVGSVIYIAYLSTLLAYSLWSFLLNQYPTATIAPFTVMVPIFGFLGSMALFGEQLQSWKIVAAIFVIGGLSLNVFESKLIKAKAYFEQLQ